MEKCRAWRFSNSRVLCKCCGFIVPLFVSARVHYHDHFLNSAPTSVIGRASWYGWMNEEILSDYMHHLYNTLVALKKEKYYLS